jgi:hypothetical protein
MDWNGFNNRTSAQVLAADCLDDLLAELGVDLTRHPGGAVYRGQCPVHGGRDKNFDLRTNGDLVPINWHCYSHGCHREYKPSLLGLVRGVLSCQADKKVSLWTAAGYLKRFLASLPLEARSSPSRSPSASPKPTLTAWSREQVRARLVIPSPYFVTRGFSPAILDGLDVGHSPKLGRSVVPLYDDQGEVCVGYISRSERPPCDRCGGCHHLTEDCRYKQAKWSFPPGFSKGAYLYNYQNARQSPSPLVLLVEGPGDVFKAAEAGLTAVALLGTDLSDQQVGKLAVLGKEVVICLDNDRAGKEQAGVAWKRVWARAVWASIWSPPEKYKDLGEMPVEEVAPWMERRRFHG